jgi:hypothetical protein
MKMPRQIISEGDKKYVIDNQIDGDIFNRIKELENKKLNKNDKKVVVLIKTQLEGNWRKYLVEELNKLLIKYK